jgi:hypothetical protein
MLQFDNSKLVVTYLKVDMRETGSKIRSIYVELFLSGNIHVVAFRTVDFYSASGQFLTHTDRQNILTLAQNSRALTKCTQKEFLFHELKAAWGKNESSVY